jgi:hypothetical protein
MISPRNNAGCCTLNPRQKQRTTSRAIQATRQTLRAMSSAFFTMAAPEPAFQVASALTAANIPP